MAEKLYPDGAILIYIEILRNKKAPIGALLRKPFGAIKKQMRKGGETLRWLGY